MEPETLFFNGINGATGEYLLPPLTAEDISKIACGEKFDPAHLSELKYRVESTHPSFDVADPKKLEETGWGVIFPKEVDPAIKVALQPLLDHRRKQATLSQEHYYQEYTYYPGQSTQKFLLQNGVGPGPANPDKMPYYLLIVGDPETIPFRFQYQLDVQFAVGRIHFNTFEEYANYAQSIVNAETNPPTRPRQAKFFGVRNSGDEATQLSADHLVKPLAEWVAQDQPTWTVSPILQEDATKARLGQLLGGTETPALLFTASHGMGFPKDDSRQLPHQGALLCQDWPGIQWGRQPIPPDFYFSQDDISEDADLLGLISFHFACYGAGTPQLEDFAKKAFQTPQPLASHAFVAHLPQRLLSHPKGGALAVVGHIERAWGYSFFWNKAGEQLDVFTSTLKRLMEGHPIGSALEFFNDRYAQLSTNLTNEIEEINDYGKEADPYQLAGMWMANNDARGYAIIGDPAVRLHNK